MEREKICAVILAAGTSSRMGRMKQLMPLEDEPLVGRVIQKVLSNDFKDVYTVLGHGSDQIKERLNITDKRHHWLFNAHYKTGQSTSIKKALQHVRGEYPHVMIMLGDLPFIKDETIGMIKSAGRTLCATQTEPFIVRPLYKGKAGHPVFIGNINAHLIGQLEGDSGFRSVKNIFAVRQLMQTDDDGVNFDIDTEEEYRIAIKRAEKDNLVP